MSVFYVQATSFTYSKRARNTQETSKMVDVSWGESVRKICSMFVRMKHALRTNANILLRSLLSARNHGFNYNVESPETGACKIMHFVSDREETLNSD